MKICSHSISSGPAFFVSFFNHAPLAACPEKGHRIDETMIEYSGHEEVLIGHLSTMLTAKNRESVGGVSDGDGTPRNSSSLSS